MNNNLLPPSGEQGPYPVPEHEPPDASERGFLLHTFHRQQQDRMLICAIGKLESGKTFALTDDREQPGFYIRVSDQKALQTLASDGDVRLEDCNRTTMDGEAVIRVSNRRRAVLRKMADRLQETGIRTYEADLNPGQHYLINRNLHGAIRISGPFRPGSGIDRVYHNPRLTPTEWEPELAVLSLDIETNPDATQIYAVALIGVGPESRHRTEEIHLVGHASSDDPPELICHIDERMLLTTVATRIRLIDPDILTGWNLIDFDLPVLARRFDNYKLTFNLGRTRERSWYREGNVWGGSRMVVYGRQVLDALHLIRATLQRYEDYRLDTVARAILGRGKTLHQETDETMAERILRAYQEDRQTFCAYCLEDARLVRDILEAEGLITLTIRRSLLTGLPLERAWGSISAFDSMYITELHRGGMVAPSLGVDRNAGGGSPGGLILEPLAGLYRHVLVFDFQSLYPSIIRTFNIDPLAYIKARQHERTTVGGESDPQYDDSNLITAPNGAVFDRQAGILPGILERFFDSRARARAEGDALATFAYKIIMNSCYGVLASSACRFADDRLVGAITESGQYLLGWVRDLLEHEGYRVLYGDTDSLFVDAGLPEGIDAAAAREVGKALCIRLNRQLAQFIDETYGVVSRLELEFEKYYRRFLLPSGRGADHRGRAKGYAGLQVDDAGEQQVDIIGMEAVRRDWTDLAHTLQRELLDHLFHDTPGEEIENRVAEWVRAVHAGEKDADLVYRKNLRKPVSEYTRTMPPHVRAAQQMPNPSGVIHYVITTNGPQPVGYVTAPLDYDHYVAKQIEPLVRTIAEFCDIDLDTAVRGKPGLFRDRDFQ